MMRAGVSVRIGYLEGKFTKVVVQLEGFRVVCRGYVGYVP
jgi:hypothetical protein